jgi:hypothetical protein
MLSSPTISVPIPKKSTTADTAENRQVGGRCVLPAELDMKTPE